MINRKKLQYGLLLFLSLIACIRPQFFDIIPYIDYFYLATLAIASLISIAIFINNIKNMKFTKVISLYFIALLIPTVLYNLSFINITFFIKTYLSIWTIVVLTEYALCTKKVLVFLKTISVLILSLLLPNIMFITLFGPNYLSNRSAFLGYDNTVLPFILFGSVISLIAPHLISNRNNGLLKKLSSINTILLIVNCLIVESSNAKIAALMLIVLLILSKFKILEKQPIAKVLNLKTFTIFSIIAFLAIVVFRMQYLFEDFIVNDLHRNLSITGRTDIWDLAINSIKKHPILGVGVEDFVSRLYSEKAIYHAHSTYLNIMFECGIIGLLSYLNIFRVLWKNIKHDKTSKQITILSFATLIYFTITIVEYYTNSHTFFAMLTIIYYTPNLVAANSKKGEKK